MTKAAHAVCMTIAKIRFAHDATFAPVLRGRIDAYFEQNNIAKTANGAMVAKTIALMAIVAALYTTVVFAGLPAGIVLVLSVVLGGAMAVAGINIGHDAIHGAYSDRPWINAMLSRSFDVLGASSLTWSTAHNFVHHTYTNVPGVDHDLDPGPFMNFYQRPQPHPIYRWQHIYAFGLYCFTHIVWVFKKDFQQLRQPDPRSQRSASAGDVASVLLWKVVHVGLFLVMPLALSPHAWWIVAMSYALMLMAAGFTLAMMFQLAHVVEEVAFPAVVGVGAEARLNDGFHAHQLRTTCNFAPTSSVWGFLSGGLNHQVEHHLFSKICHIHYPALAPIVRATAAEFGLPYHEHPTMFSALASHVRAMRRFGHPATATTMEQPVMPVEARAAA
jgi:linoleoyl-CoA desaturase